MFNYEISSCLFNKNNYSVYNLVYLSLFTCTLFTSSMSAPLAIVIKIEVYYQ